MAHGTGQDSDESNRQGDVEGYNLDGRGRFVHGGTVHRDGSVTRRSVKRDDVSRSREGDHGNKGGRFRRRGE